ncbi:MAG: A/G-specific adenine glycosylase [Defluviitaleaceae bacterium]|nr:A/G-specific adenine glycosylase [Defluviitaleaceae bacterium]
MKTELLCWFAAHRRSLPWRDDPTPYAVLVGEIMAQQTRLAQLLPFYERFMVRFPTIVALADAPLDDVLAIWAGMGYYARARNLHRTAQIICNPPNTLANDTHHKPQPPTPATHTNDNSHTLPDIPHTANGIHWPTTKAEWLALPGIGPYTAGAVLSIAFAQREAAVDGNILRVAARLQNDPTDIATPAAHKNATAYILHHMPHTPDTIRLFNQALMELGSLVCTPTTPRCTDCPLVGYCQAHQHDRVHLLPIKAAKKPSPRIPMTVLLIFAPDGRVLMTRRTAGLLRNMWVFHLVQGETLDAPAVREYLQSQGYSLHKIEEITPLGTFTHTFTHRVWEMTGFAVRVNENLALTDHHFRTPDEITAGGLPSAMRYFMM